MATTKAEKATFGAGCFWGTEKFFKKQFGDGLLRTEVGYMGGDAQNPSYELVCTGRTGHAEVLDIDYDPNKVKYEDLVKFFFKMHNPTTLNRQGNDMGTQYRSVIFYYNDQQLDSAKKVRDEVSKSKVFKDPIVTEITPARTFYTAEEYHQKYLEKNPGGYCNHRIYWN